MAADEFRQERPIVLVGMMGAGKTTVGRRLAERLQLPFVDVDVEVERAAGLTVEEIFERHGEGAFREREREAVARLAGGPVQVIAAGGGAFTDSAGRALLLESCTVVWLDARAEILADRLARDGRERPMLRGRDPRAALAELAERRRPFYAAAALRVEAEPPVEAVVDALLAALSVR
jgi:shikimate kinase